MTETKVRLSATQIDNARMCMRKWAWDKIARIPRPRNPSLELGSRVHDILEGLFKSQEPPNLRETWRFEEGSALHYPGEIAASMLPALDKLAIPDDVHTELSFEDEEVGREHGIVYVGKIDLHWVTSDGPYLHIVDHKTSSSPDKWGKDIHALRNDTQAILYPRIGYSMYPEVRAHTFALNYGSTKLKIKENKLVQIADARGNTDLKYSELIEPLAVYMAEVKRKGTHPLKLEPNASACEMFGGCPYKDNCKLTASQRMRGIMSKDKKLSKVEELMERARLKKLAAQSEEKQEAGAFNPPEADEITEDSTAEETQEKEPAEEKKAEPVAENKPPKKGRKKAAEVPVKEALPQSGQKTERKAPADDLERKLLFIAGLAVGANPALAPIVKSTLEKGEIE